MSFAFSAKQIRIIVTVAKLFEIPLIATSKENVHVNWSPCTEY